jgi:hypothetical protein
LNIPDRGGVKIFEAVASRACHSLLAVKHLTGLNLAATLVTREPEQVL